MSRLARPINRADVSSRYIPKGARKVADRQSDAVAYLYETAGKPYAIAYCGKRAKPDWHHRFPRRRVPRKARCGLLRRPPAFRSVQDRAA